MGHSVMMLVANTLWLVDGGRVRLYIFERFFISPSGTKGRSTRH